MGRPLRIDAEGAWHHVMNRGAGRRITFRDDAERVLFLDLVGELETRFGLEVHCFCLMDNHFHLLVKSTAGRLSDGLKWLGSIFTKEVNARRSVDGAIFRGRFHSVLVERDAHLIWLFRYINANPVELGWSRRLSEFPWSGLACSLGQSSEYGWLRHDLVRSHFGESPERLEGFVEAARSGQIDAIGGTPDFAEVEAAVSVASGPGPRVNTDAERRAAAVFVACDIAGLALDAVSWIASLDRRSQCRAIARARQRAETDDEVAGLVARTISVLAATTGV